MNDIMFEPRCPKCKDLGWIAVNDREYPCDCNVDGTEYEIARDLDEENYDY